jgi:hypothetical protein
VSHDAGKRFGNVSTKNQEGGADQLSEACCPKRLGKHGVASDSNADSNVKMQRELLDEEGGLAARFSTT